MDLEEFDVLDKIAGSLAPQDYFSARDALDYIDSQWYTKTNRRARCELSRDHVHLLYR
jgi:hypothetical protein